MATDVNLPSIANKTGDFTGADLGALLADSQLAAVRALLASKQSEQVMVRFIKPPTLNASITLPT